MWGRQMTVGAGSDPGATPVGGSGPDGAGPVGGSGPGGGPDSRTTREVPAQEAADAQETVVEEPAAQETRAEEATAQEPAAQGAATHGAAAQGSTAQASTAQATATAEAPPREAAREPAAWMRALPEWLRRESATWHRFHYAVGVFLVAYGVTGLISGVLMWGDRQDEVQGYFGGLPATAVLLLVKFVELALTASAAAALAFRKDLLLVPPTAGWMAGFAMFAVLDVFTARWGGLVQHLLYLAAFVVLLFLSYGLSAKAQLAAAARAAKAAGDGGGTGDDEAGNDGSGDGAPGGGMRLTRTQEFALAAINRAAALTGPRPRPRPRD